jgi:DNA polymerase delta subunit 1
LRRTLHIGIIIDAPMNEERGGSSRDVKYQGATVLEPKRGFYYIPIVTLDFASLYPSIMIANNLCYVTYLNYDPVVMAEFCKNNPEGYRESPIGARFVKEDILEGLLPRILIDLLDARKQAKND